MSVFDRIYDDISGRKKAEKDFKPYVPGNNGRIDRCVRFFEQGILKPGESMIDVGGAIGDLADALRDRFTSRCVLDISEIPLAAAVSKGHDAVKSNVDEDGISGADGTADFIAMLDVIEHIMDPEQLARECHRVLKTGGQAYINTPNILYWRHLSHMFATRRFPHTSGDREVFHGGHTAFFTQMDVFDIFSNAGLSCRLLTDQSTYDPPPAKLMQFLIENYYGRNVAHELMSDLAYPDVLMVAEKL